MDIEQMRIRMGEMAAEIERLQSVIDEANAQPSCAECGNGDQGLALYCVKCIDTIQQSPGLNFTVMQALATLKTEVLGLESPVYAIQLIERIEAEQQSPAVAVPYWVLSAIKRCLCPSESCDFHGNKDPYISGGCCNPELQKAITYLESPVSPRITEQDADAIVNSAVNFMYETKSRHSIDYWLFEEGHALLDKLNGKPESVGG